MTATIANEVKRPNNLPFNAAYRSGHSKRCEGKKKVIPVHFRDTINKHWWIAGWNDADIELCAHTT